jgi:hypothetical protein
MSVDLDLLGTLHVVNCVASVAFAMLNLQRTVVAGCDTLLQTSRTILARRCSHTRCMLGFPSKKQEHILSGINNIGSRHVYYQ